MPDESPPEYVSRDADDGEFGVRAKVAAAARRGGFVLLVGGSSVGKTRCAFEAVTALLPDWWLVHPAGPDQVAALAQAASPRTVVWLDELQRYLDGENGLAAAAVRALLADPQPAVIIGTLWPDRYNTYTAVPTPGAADLHARERQVLDLAVVIRIAPEFSPAEKDRARAAAARDRRLAAALEATGYGLTQTLAAAPQLVARWQDAKTADPYAWAVLTAALDVARLGARAPLSPDLLRAAAPGYCTSAQQAEAPNNWFEQALAYATEKLHGAAAALSPEGAGMGQIVGYTVADYLIQHASRERRSARLPTTSWDAILRHVRDPADAARLADSASNRLLHCYAIPLYRHAAVGNNIAAWRLADLLTQRGDLDGVTQVLRTRADAGDRSAASRLACLLAERGDVDELRAMADAGDQDAGVQLVGLLAGRSDLDGLRAMADAGDNLAASLLTELLAQHGDLEGLRTRAAAGDREALWLLANLMAERGDLDGATQILRTRSDVGDHDAARRLAILLAEHGDLDGAEQVLRTLADPADPSTGRLLADLLVQRGDVEGLRARAAAGDRDAASRLANLLAEHGDLDGATQILRILANPVNFAAWRQAELLALCGDVDGLRAMADAGNSIAARRLADLLAQHGDVDGATQVLRTPADSGDREALWLLVELLAERGDVDELRARADAGDSSAAWRLAELLAERGDVDELRAMADAGEDIAAQLLAGLLAERGDVDGLRARADAGDTSATEQLAKLLAEHGDLDGLHARIGAGDSIAARRLADLLDKRGRHKDFMPLTWRPRMDETWGRAAR